MRAEVRKRKRVWWGESGGNRHRVYIVLRAPPGKLDERAADARVRMAIFDFIHVAGLGIWQWIEVYKSDPIFWTPENVFEFFDRIYAQKCIRSDFSKIGNH